jgi:hypothetical protein
MGAFSIYLELILPRILRAFEYDRVKQARAVTALTKLITLDEQLALAGYFAETPADPVPRLPLRTLNSPGRSAA